LVGPRIGEMLVVAGIRGPADGWGPPPCLGARGGLYCTAEEEMGDSNTNRRRTCDWRG
jgi:hypothetical protein